MFGSCFNNLKISKNIFLNLPHFTTFGLIYGLFLFLSVIKIKLCFAQRLVINFLYERSKYKKIDK